MLFEKETLQKIILVSSSLLQTFAYQFCQKSKRLDKLLSMIYLIIFVKN